MHDNMVCLLNSYLYVMFRSCFESLASVVPIKLVCATRCGTPCIVAHRTYMGSCGGKNDWQFSNPRIDTGYWVHDMNMGSIHFKLAIHTCSSCVLCGLYPSVALSFCH